MAEKLSAQSTNSRTAKLRNAIRSLYGKVLLLEGKLITTGRSGKIVVRDVFMIPQDEPETKEKIEPAFDELLSQINASIAETMKIQAESLKLSRKLQKEMAKLKAA